MDDKTLAEIEARANAATDGPWRVKYAKHVTRAGSEHWIQTAEGCNGIVVHDGGGEQPSRDVDFIAHAREDVPALVAEVRRLRGLLSRCRDDGVLPVALAQESEAMEGSANHG